MIARILLYIKKEPERFSSLKREFQVLLLYRKYASIMRLIVLTFQQPHFQR